jgi:hypothetical protein
VAFVGEGRGERREARAADAVVVGDQYPHPEPNRLLLSLLVGLVHLRDAEVPVEDEVLALGVSDHALTVAAKLGVVRGKQHQPGKRPLPELLDQCPVTEIRLDLPVGGDRTQVDHPNMSPGRLRFLQLLG